MGVRPTFVGLIALAVVVFGAGELATPPSAMAEFRIPGLFGGTKATKRKRYRVRRPVAPVRNPDRVTAGVSATATSPKVAANSGAAVVAGMASAGHVVLALPAPKANAAAERPSPESRSAGAAASQDDPGDATAEGVASAGAAAADGTVSEPGEAVAEDGAKLAESKAGSEVTVEIAAAPDAAPVEDKTDVKTAAAEAAASRPASEPSNEPEPANADAPDSDTAGTDGAASASDARSAPSATEPKPEMARASEPSPPPGPEPKPEAIGSSEDSRGGASAPPAETKTDEKETADAAEDPKATESSDVAAKSGADKSGEDTGSNASAAHEAAAKPGGDNERGEDAEAPAETAVADPKSAEPKSAESESAESMPAAPEAAEPDTSRTETSEADTAEPSTAEPNATDPERAQPETNDLASAPGPSPVDANVYDATVVLDISPPPSDGKPEETEVAALTAPDAESADETPHVEAGPPPPPPAHPVVAAVREKLEGPGAPKLATADLDALKTFYGADGAEPLWTGDDGLSAKAKTVIATIHDAGDWGLDAASYPLPSTGAVPADEKAQADAELALSAAILKYARHAQTGRLTPARVNKLFDQNPEARDPQAVLTEIAASESPDKALLSLHPQHPQYRQLHEALVQARKSAKTVGRNPDTDRNVQLIVMNMERWRWLPRDLGNYYVWNNIPEFQVRALKGGQTIYQEKTIVGQYKYATPFFSAKMRNVVFHPNWTVPPTIVTEDIAPKLKGPGRGGLFGAESKKAMLRRYGLAVSYRGEPVDADTIDWANENVHKYTFTQDPGPYNVLGNFKFNFPNEHAIYMHDTTQRHLFAQQRRTLSHGCIRVHQPDRFAALILGEDKGWSMGQVQSVLANSEGQTKVVSLNRPVPVHLTYFTATANGGGSVEEFGDVYGIDKRMAQMLFSAPAYFPMPDTSEIAETAAPPQATRTRSSRRRRSASGSLDNFISGIFGN